MNFQLKLVSFISLNALLKLQRLKCVITGNLPVMMVTLKSIKAGAFKAGAWSIVTKIISKDFILKDFMTVGLIITYCLNFEHNLNIDEHQFFQN